MPTIIRPLLGYSDLNEATNNLYSNYNALQVSWARHTGLYTIQANYTWQKALGIVSPTGNPFSLSADYGIQPTDRRNLFNAAYSIDLGQRVHVNPFVNGALNGWQFSGVTQLESGANVTYSGGYNASTNYNLQITCTDPNKTGPVPNRRIHSRHENGCCFAGRCSAQQSIHPGNEWATVESAGHLQSQRESRFASVRQSELFCGADCPGTGTVRTCCRSPMGRGSSIRICRSSKTLRSPKNASSRSGHRRTTSLTTRSTRSRAAAT